MPVTRGLGMVHRGRRTAWAYLEGQLRRIYRTSKLVLTSMGRMLLGLGAREDERQAKRRAQTSRRGEAPPAPMAASTAEHPPPQHRRPARRCRWAARRRCGSWWIKKVKKDLGVT